MNVLMLNGSAKPKGCTYTALEEIGRTLAEEGVSYEIFQLGPAPSATASAAANAPNTAASLPTTP